MIKKTMLIIILTILFSGMVSADELYHIGTRNNVYELDECVGDFFVKIHMDVEDEQFQIVGCKKDAIDIWKSDNVWRCRCQNPTFVEFLTVANSSQNEFDFKIQYYLSDNQSEESKRVYSVNNIKVVSTNYKEPKKSVSMPSFNGGFVIATVIIIILIVVIVGIYLIIKWMLKDPPGSDEDIDKNSDIRRPRTIDQIKQPNQQVDEVDEVLAAILREAEK